MSPEVASVTAWIYGAALLIIVLFLMLLLGIWGLLHEILELLRDATGRHPHPPERTRPGREDK